MRLRGAALAAVLAGSVLTGVAGSSAVAATNPSITIKAYDRAGKLIPITASLQSPVTSPTGIDETLTSKHPTQVPPGTYNISAWVNEPGGSAQTLVSRELIVKKSATVTFDARKGHRILFIADDPTVAQDNLIAEPYSPNGWDAFDSYGGPSAPAVYAVPGTMAPGYVLSLEADLIRPNEFLSPVEYVIVRQLNRFIPSDLTFHVKTASLASDHVTVKEIDPGQSGGIAFQPELGQNPGNLPALPMGQSAFPPFSIEFHFSPGYEWQAQTFSGTQDLNDLTVFGVHHYSQTFDNATFGPTPEFFVDVVGNELQAPAPTANGEHMFADPTQDESSSFGMNVSSGKTWLYEGSKLLASGTSGWVSAKIPAGPHWYTLRAQANRGSGATLWKSETLSFNFRTQPNANPDMFWPLTIPSGLSSRNAAAHGTKTAVRIYFDNLSIITAHAVKAWASLNGGKTWLALHVTRSGPHWTVIVTNPGTPGYVSLRVQGTDAAGDTASVTTINAYRVS